MWRCVERLYYFFKSVSTTVPKSNYDIQEGQRRIGECPLQFTVLPKLLAQMHRLSNSELLELQRTCGRSTKLDETVSAKQPHFKLAFANEAQIGDFPWAVLLESRIQKPESSSPSKEVSTCTGVLISRWHFLSAAHCLEINDRGLVNVNVMRDHQVMAGSPCAYDVTRLGRQDDCRYNTARLAKKLKTRSFVVTEASIRDQIVSVLLFCTKLQYRKPDKEEQCALSNHAASFKSMPSSTPFKAGQYKFTVPFSDVVLFELDEPVDVYDSSIKPICLSLTYDVFLQTVQVFGFGVTEKSKNNVRLHYFTDHVLGVAETLCDTFLKIADCSRMIVWQSNPGEPRSACHGDSGGGLSTLQGGRYYLQGLISVGQTFCDIRKSNTVIS
ncbi:unnamed protein product [Gongylonema pulchrum]|uniref:Peptidase S1 domain-containing protein n=1 Tax=Gongylonema pulchrum TaxID=637853 RepID=A0A183CWA5_9BILA|nr:unnamed protein product [Gongylonema pulchrum]